jgi:hypothetical protein
MRTIEGNAETLTSGETGVYQHKLSARQVTTAHDIHNSTEMIQAVIDVENRYGSVTKCPNDDPEMRAIQRYSAKNHRELMSKKRAEITETQSHATEIVTKRYLEMVPLADIASEIYYSQSQVDSIIKREKALGHLPRGQRRRMYLVKINGRSIVGTSKQIMARTGLSWPTIRTHPFEALNKAGFNDDQTK